VGLQQIVYLQHFQSLQIVAGKGAGFSSPSNHELSRYAV